MRNATLVGKKFREFFFPTILMSASASLSLIVDSIIVGNVLGDSELAAVNLIMPLSLCFTAVSAMFGIGSATCISMFKGKMENEQANRCLTLSVVAWIACSVVAILLCLTSSTAIATFLSGDSGLDHLVYDYLKVYLFGSPFTFATLIFPHIIKADGLPKFSSNTLIVANVTNLLMDIVYMKCFHLGIAGAALATITGNALGTILYIIYIKSRKRTIGLTKIRLSDLKLYIDMFKMSISSIFGQGLMFAKMWVFNMLVAKTAGQAGLTAFSICTSCLSFVSMFIAGGAQTMIPMVGAFSGAQDDTAIKYTIHKAFKLVLTCCIGVTILFELFPNVVMAAYGVNGGEALDIGVTAIRIFSLSFLFIGFNFMYMYYMQSKKMPAFSMQICALDGFFVVVPAGFVLSHFLGSNGVWISYIVNGVIVALFITAKSKYMVTKSNGALYSLFMLEVPQNDCYERTVDVSNDMEIEQTITDLVTKINHVRAEELVRMMFELSKLAYQQKGGYSKEAVVDVILSHGKLSMKDMGMDYRRLKEQGYVEKMKAINDSYEHTLMIGMNYATVDWSEGRING